jgi:hypothetical protein
VAAGVGVGRSGLAGNLDDREPLRLCRLFRYRLNSESLTWLPRAYSASSCPGPGIPDVIPFEVRDIESPTYLWQQPGNNVGGNKPEAQELGSSICAVDANIGCIIFDTLQPQANRGPGNLYRSHRASTKLSPAVGFPLCIHYSRHRLLGASSRGSSDLIALTKTPHQATLLSGWPCSAAFWLP